MLRSGSGRLLPFQVKVDAHKTVRDLQEREPGIKTAEELVKSALKKMAAGR